MKSKRLGLEINVMKLKVMVTGRVEEAVVNTLNSTRLETVEQFVSVVNGVIIR